MEGKKFEFFFLYYFIKLLKNFRLDNRQFLMSFDKSLLKEIFIFFLNRKHFLLKKIKLKSQF